MQICPGALCRDAMTEVMDVCDLSSRQHAALKTVIKVTSRGKVGDHEKVRRSRSRSVGRSVGDVDRRNGYIASD